MGRSRRELGVLFLLLIAVSSFILWQRAFLEPPSVVLPPQSYEVNTHRDSSLHYRTPHSFNDTALHTTLCSSRPRKLNPPSESELKKLRSRKTFIAINMKDNEKVIPHFLRELLRTVELLGKENVFISIYESGSDDATPQWIQFFDDILDLLSIPHFIVTKEDEYRKNVHRMEWMARMRNAALQPLYDSPMYSYQKLIFLNDVYFCMEDIRRMLFFEEAAVVCGLDYIYKSPTDFGFYDTLVMRDSKGQFVGHKMPYINRTSDPEAAARCQQGRAFPVFSCWNGLIVSSAQPFYEGLRFRRSIQGKPRNECSSSECLLFCRDMMMRNYTKIMIDPQVRVAYNEEGFKTVSGILEGMEYNPSEYNNPDKNIAFLKQPPPQYHCFPMISNAVSAPDGKIYWEDTAYLPSVPGDKSN